VPTFLLPRRVGLTALRQSQVTSYRRPAIVQGSSWYDTGTILDENGDPFNLGPTLAPLWTLSGQIRYDIADRSTTPLVSFAVEVLDGPLGRVAYSLTPAVSILLATDRPLVWDFDATNNGDQAFTPTWRATIWSGPVSVIRDVTR
jgi:hypothetical protein